MRSHLTAFGVGAGLSLLAAGLFALIAPKLASSTGDEDGVHIVNIGRGESGTFRIRDGRLDLEATWKGEFAFSADGRSLNALKGELAVVSKTDGVERKAVFKKRDDEIVATVNRDGAEIVAENDAAQEAADLLQLLSRSSGVNAQSRVKAMLSEGGKERVMTEIGALRGAHATSAYVEELANAASLSQTEVASLLEKLRGLESDYAKRNALSALIRTQKLNEQSVAAALDVAGSIEADHEVRLIVEEISENDLAGRMPSLAVDLIGKIENDHEVRLAIAALLESDRVSGEAAARALALAAERIEGDYELRLAVEAAGDRIKSPPVAAAALRAIEAIEGDHDRRLAIEELAGRIGPEAEFWPAVINAAASVGGDYERRLAIEAVASSAPQREDLRAALQKAAETISSDHERRLAFEAID